MCSILTANFIALRYTEIESYQDVIENFLVLSCIENYVFHCVINAVFLLLDHFRQKRKIVNVHVCVFQCQPTALLRASGSTQGE